MEAWVLGIPRWNRHVTVTEKIDGENGLIEIKEGTLGSILQFDPHGNFPSDRAHVLDESRIGEDGLPEFEFHVRAGSRNRWITPDDDMNGFASWVFNNAQTLVADLGPGMHRGEWFGKGIKRGYGLNEKRFALFNVKRWGVGLDFTTPNLTVVPVLWTGQADDLHSGRVELQTLKHYGSQAVPGFKDPEGIVIYHHAANQLFKVTLENDSKGKGSKIPGASETLPKGKNWAN